MDEMDEHPTTQHRPALRPPVVAELPEGRKLLPRAWWYSDFEPGTTLLARRLVQQRRAYLRKVGRMKHDSDVTGQNEQRRHAGWCWQCDQLALHRFFGRSNAIH